MKQVSQRRFDAMAQKMQRDPSAVPFLLLDCDLRIRAMNAAYEQVSLREHDELTGEYLFDAFPDDPDDPQARGMANLAASVENAMRTGRTHNMWLQRYDIRDPASPDKFLPKVWSPSNAPLFDEGELVGVVHRVEEVAEFARAVSALARALDSGALWSSTDLLHTLAAVRAAEDVRQAQRQQALVAQTEQLRHAIDTRDTIGQAKGMLMERFDIDATAAFNLLVRLSQNTNTRVEHLARKLLDVDHPPRSTRAVVPLSRAQDHQQPTGPPE